MTKTITSNSSLTFSLFIPLDAWNTLLLLLLGYKCWGKSNGPLITKKPSARLWIIMIGCLLYSFCLLMLHCLFNRGRIKRLDDSTYKLNKYCEAINLRKQQRNDLLPNEKSVGLNSLKMGTQIHRSFPDIATQRLKDRTKNVVMNKRV